MSGKRSSTRVRNDAHQLVEQFLGDPSASKRAAALVDLRELLNDVETARPESGRVPPARDTRTTRGAVARATGYRYPVLERELDRLSLKGQEDLRRLIRDFESKVRSVQARARNQPWRRI